MRGRPIDINGEYAKAFPGDPPAARTPDRIYLNGKELRLPLWFLNAEEICAWLSAAEQTQEPVLKDWWALDQLLSELTRIKKKAAGSYCDAVTGHLAKIELIPRGSRRCLPRTARSRAQRPSEISQTIISQCANFIGHRLQNPDDIDHFRRIIPMQARRLLDQETILSSGEAIVFGSAFHILTRVEFDRPEPGPYSQTAAPFHEWSKEKAPFPLTKVIDAWVGSEARPSVYHGPSRRCHPQQRCRGTPG
ncbi:hypothetical protein [Bosea sp. TAF32]|uniref:hypothetical protein n=1 Tax=Bosea sp. TAF32 TaxID=3237482 RepID=UPI003F916B2C